MDITPGELNGPLATPTSPRKIARVLLVLGIVVGVVLFGWFAWKLLFQDGGISSRNDPTTNTPTPPTTEEIMEQMSIKDPNLPTVTDAEKQQLIDAMSQQITPPATTGTKASGTVQPQSSEPTPVSTSAERQKLMDAMQQKATE
jgi:hypothetical protein